MTDHPEIHAPDKMPADHVAWCQSAAEARAKEAEVLISAVLSCHEQYGLGIYTPMVLKRIRDDLNAMLEGKEDGKAA